MASKQTIGTYNGTPIYAGTDAEVAAQVAAIDAKKTGSVTTPKTQAELDAQYASAVTAHPAVSSVIAKGNTPEAVAYAASTGDYSGLVGGDGKPFSAKDQQDALATATAATSPYYQAEQAYETANTADVLKQKQLDYEKQLADEAAKFQTDKTTLDQNAANQGVLFSGGRAQKEQQLSANYNRSQEYNRASTANDIGGTARAYEYKYGTPAAQGLSQYYTLGSNTYDPSKAVGGVTSGGLSTIYNANNGFQGTQVNAGKAAAQTRAAGLLANKANKIVPYGYKTQF